MAVIEVIGLRRTYRTTTGVVRRRPLEVEAVRGISFAVPDASIIALVGANGAGKTSTLNAITGLVSSRGRIVSGGKPLTGGELPGSDGPDLQVWHLN